MLLLARGLVLYLNLCGSEKFRAQSGVGRVGSEFFFLKFIFFFEIQNLPCVACHGLHCLSMHITVVCLGACVQASVRVHACVRVYMCAMLVCGRQCGCGFAYMGACACVGACVCVRTCVLAHITANFPELACSHDKRCTPTLSGCARRSGSRLRPNVWLFHVTVVWMGSLLRIVLCMPSGVRSSA